MNNNLAIPAFLVFGKYYEIKPEDSQKKSAGTGDVNSHIPAEGIRLIGGTRKAYFAYSEARLSRMTLTLI